MFANQHTPSLQTGKQKTLSPFFQPKITSNQPNDKYEQKADAIADQVMRTPDLPAQATPFFKPSVSPTQCKRSNCLEEEKRLQRKEAGNSLSTMSPAVMQTIQSPGQAMDTSTERFMQARMGHNFSGVQIHNDAVAHQSAADINALAYTHGNHVVFGAGQYKPETNDGKKLIAHELVHVAQQQKGVNSIMLSPDTESSEEEAYPLEMIPDLIELGYKAPDDISNGNTFKFKNISDTIIEIKNLTISNEYFKIYITGTSTIEPGAETFFYMSFSQTVDKTQTGSIIVDIGTRELFFSVIGQPDTASQDRDQKPLVTPAKQPSNSHPKAYRKYLEEKAAYLLEQFTVQDRDGKGPAIESCKTKTNELIANLNKVADVYDEAYQKVEDAFKQANAELAVRAANKISDSILGDFIIDVIADGLVDIIGLIPSLKAAKLFWKVAIKTSAYISEQIEGTIVEKTLEEALKDRPASGIDIDKGREFIAAINPKWIRINVYDQVEKLYRAFNEPWSEIDQVRDHFTFILNRRESLPLNLLDKIISRSKEGLDELTKIVSSLNSISSDINRISEKAKTTAESANTETMEFQIWKQWLLLLGGDAEKLQDENKKLLFTKPIQEALERSVYKYIPKVNDTEDQLNEVSKYDAAEQMIGKASTIIFYETKGSIYRFKLNIENDDIAHQQKELYYFESENPNDNLAIGDDIEVTGVKALSNSEESGLPTLLGKITRKNARFEKASLGLNRTIVSPELYGVNKPPQLPLNGENYPYEIVIGDGKCQIGTGREFHLVDVRENWYSQINKGQPTLIIKMDNC